MKQLRQLPALLVLLLPICSYSSEDLYVQNMTCSSTYPIQLQSITAECTDYCTLGTTANFGTWISYSGVSMASAKIKVNVNFIPKVNMTKANQNNLGYVNVGIMSYNTHFSEVVDVCQDGYSCTNKGQFYFGFQYQLPSFGSSLNSIIDEYQLQFDISSYDYDTYANSNNMKMLGNCEVFLTSDGSTVVNTVYAKAASNGYFLFAAALVGTFAALSVLKKNNKTEKKIFNCIDDEGSDIGAFFQMPNEFEKVETTRKHSIPEKIFEFKNYVSESATMFWEETHSWPRAGSNFTQPFGTTDETSQKGDDELLGLEDGVLSGSIVSVSDGGDEASSLSNYNLHSKDTIENDNDGENQVAPSFSCAVEAKEVNNQDENKFFVDDMKIVPSVDKKLTFTESSSEDEEEENEVEEREEEHEKNTVKKDTTTIVKNTKPANSSVKKSANSQKSSASRFSMKRMFGGSKGFVKV